MSFIAVGIGLSVAGSAIGAISANKAKKEAERKDAMLTAELEEMKNSYSMLDTSNPYSNMENTMEDLTIEQRQFDLDMQQFNQSQSNTLEKVKEAAGSSGIAAVAGELAREGKIATQQASSTIGMQETENQHKKVNMAKNLQYKEREGEIYSRNQKKDMAGTFLGMAQQEYAAYEEQAAAAKEAKWKALAGGVDSIGNMLVQPPGMGGGGAMVKKEKPIEYPPICPGMM